MEFVTLKLAKKLEEKGFCWDLITTYNKKTEVRCNHLTPTISQVLKWLREEKDVNIVIIQYHKLSVYGWYFTIYKSAYYMEISSKVKRFEFVSFEQAALAGIEYAVDNLI